MDTFHKTLENLEINLESLLSEPLPVVIKSLDDLADLRVERLFKLAKTSRANLRVVREYNWRYGVGTNPK